MDASRVLWIKNYLTGKPQFMRLQNCVSTHLVNIRAPEQTVLSPFLLTICISDFKHNYESCYLQTLSNDTAIVGCVGGGQEEEFVK